MSLGWRTLPTLGMKGTWRSKNKAELKEIKLLRRKMGRSDLVWFGIEEMEGGFVRVLQYV